MFLLGDVDPYAEISSAATVDLPCSEVRRGADAYRLRVRGHHVVPEEAR